MNIFSQNSRDALSIGLLVLVISILHYSTDVSMFYIHDIYKTLYYIPIILAAFRFGRRGGLLVASVIAIIYVPHVIEAWIAHPEVKVNRFLEIVTYFVVAYITGLLVESERQERFRHEKTAAELRIAYDKLRRHSEYLAEVEEQLRMAERLATLGELTASLAHEVRNPLAAIKGTVEILRDDYPKNGKNQEFFTLLIADVDRIERVISSYLGQVVSSRSANEQFEIVHATETVAQILQAKARKERKTLETRLPVPPLYVKGEEIRFRQIILNLLLNAFAATEANAKIRLEMRVVGNQRAGRRIEIDIIDDGCGIKEEHLAKVFKPFFTTRDGGTGLGLSIAKRIADEYGWEFTINSRWQVGTTAHLALPELDANHAEKKDSNRR